MQRSLHSSFPSNASYRAHTDRYLSTRAPRRVYLRVALAAFKSSREYASGRRAMSVTLHTNFGAIKLELYCAEAPRACENFLALCASNYYDSTLFHRNIKGFMIQGGDPTGTGKGGRCIFDTPSGKFEDEIAPSLHHNTRGILSMANSGPNTNGSQFFMTYAAHDFLDGTYTIFGHVIDGLEVLDKLEKVPCGEDDRPLQEIRLNKVTIHANPIAL